MATIKIKIEGAREVVRHLDKTPEATRRAMRREAKDIATSLADWIKADARARGGPQGARAGSTVREGNLGFWPMITASNTGAARGRKPSKKGGGVLFSSVFGQNQRSGWYAHRRYAHSRGRQYHPHIGYPGYWFFSTAKRKQQWIEEEWHKAVNDVIYEWGA